MQKDAEVRALERLEKSGLPLNLLTELERLDEYQTATEVVKTLGVDKETIYRWGMTDKIRFAIIRHNPPNYDEVRYEQDEVKITTEYRTVVFIGSKQKSPLEIFYLRSEDVVS